MRRAKRLCEESKMELEGIPILKDPQKNGNPRRRMGSRWKCERRTKIKYSQERGERR